jgi:hypothetical protein
MKIIKIPMISKKAGSCKPRHHFCLRLSLSCSSFNMNDENGFTNLNIYYYFNVLVLPTGIEPAQISFRD